MFLALLFAVHKVLILNFYLILKNKVRTLPLNTTTSCIYRE